MKAVMDEDTKDEDDEEEEKCPDYGAEDKQDDAMPASCDAGKRKPSEPLGGSPRRARES